MINKESDANIGDGLKDNQEKMFHYNLMIKNLTEENRRLQNEIQILHAQKCDLTNRLKLLTEEHRLLYNQNQQTT